MSEGDYFNYQPYEPKDPLRNGQIYGPHSPEADTANNRDPATTTTTTGKRLNHTLQVTSNNTTANHSLPVSPIATPMQRSKSAATVEHTAALRSPRSPDLNSALYSYKSNNTHGLKSPMLPRLATFNHTDTNTNSSNSNNNPNTGMNKASLSPFARSPGPNISNSIKQQLNNFHLQPLKSNIPNTNSTTNTNSTNTATNDLNSIYNTNVNLSNYTTQAQLLYNSSSAGSSARSSRVPSIPNSNSTKISALQQPQQQQQHSSHSKHPSLISHKSGNQIATFGTSKKYMEASTPTLMISPELASSLNTLNSTQQVAPPTLKHSKSSNTIKFTNTATTTANSNGNRTPDELDSISTIQGTPTNSTNNNILFSPTTSNNNTTSNGTSTATLPNTNNSNSNNNNNNNNNNGIPASNSASTATLSQTTTIPGLSTRTSLSNANSSLSLRSYKKQYILNEQLYLERMKNKIRDDEYYTREIVPSAGLGDSDNDDFESDMDEFYELNNNKFKNSNATFGINFFTTDIYNNDNLNIGDINDPNNTYVTNMILANRIDSLQDNLLAVSSSYLFNKMDWIKNTNPDKSKLIDDLKTAINERQASLDPTISIQSINNHLDSLLQDPNVLERFEWQTMLFNVLKGDIVKSEKTKIANENMENLKKEQTNEIWLELRSWMNGRNVEEQRKALEVLRKSSDVIFNEILEFKIDNDMNIEQATEKIGLLLDKYHKVVNLWPNMKKLNLEKPITKSVEFNTRIEALISWSNIVTNFNYEVQRLSKWVGLKDLKCLIVAENDDEDNLKNNEIKTQFAEQLMKEKDIETIFQTKIFFPLAPWILKSKISFLKYHELYKEINLPFNDTSLLTLLLFPMKLLKEVITIRLAYAKKLQNPTMMMIDQMIDDFSSYIRLSVQMKSTLNNYSEGWDIRIPADIDVDKMVIKAIKYLFILLNLKILDGTTKTFRTSKEPEILLKYWDDLKNVGYYIEGAGEVVSNGFSKLTVRLLHRLHSYLLQQQNSPPKLKSPADAEKWLNDIFENLGSMKRKLNRFTNVLVKAFQNCIHFNIDNYDNLIDRLKNSGHFLLYSGGDLENNGFYIFASHELLGSSDHEILKILHSTNICSDLLPTLDIQNSLAIYNWLEIEENMNNILVKKTTKNGIPYHNIRLDATNMHDRFIKNMAVGNKNTSEIFNIPVDAGTEVGQEFRQLEFKLQSLGYILVLRPTAPVVWDGKMYNLSSETKIEFDNTFLKMPPNSITLINQGSSYALDYQCDRFLQVMGSTVTFLEKKCLLDNIEYCLQRINKSYFACTYTMLNDYTKIIKTFKAVSDSKDVLNGIYLFCRDFGRNFLKNNIANGEKKSLIISLMGKISIDWLTFLSEECDPTDPKTFKWCVTAMEYAMQMVSGWNILTLDEIKFKSLKQKISACMSLLISHFDVMGARAAEVETTNQQIRANVDIISDADVDAMLLVNSRLRIESIEKMEQSLRRKTPAVGKVLDETQGTNKYLSSLASSLSNVSIRWQKRKYVGGGTFGSVYSAINLDNGDILAVKEIKIQDSKAMDKIFPSIKEEMNVMEMLNHPNIIQYFGVEVHRDRVNIFMEYCEGGSMANLLEHGRIEDEMVTQVYTLELLEGLAYLHESGIVHRDIKPENILLDFNGIIKYVDFGAARKIAKNGTKVHEGHTKSLSSSSDANQGMIGTPMYMAPESITGSKHKGAFGADDVWSLGCVVLEMITGRRPWSNLDNEWAIMYQVAVGQIPQLPNRDEVSNAGRKFLKRCLVHDPSKRATAVELLMDPWIVEIREIAFGPPNSNSATNTMDNIPIVKEENDH